jgi:5-(carboxyamino)imidazole ribonucleotide synthase
MKKIGILGGGQLGRMLLQSAVNYPVKTYLMENDEHAPAAHLAHFFTKGDITAYDDVYNFGKQLDAITIEIENVNIEALEKLFEEGVKVYPHPHALRIIKNKISQKEFYKSNEIPTSEFIVTNSLADLQNHASFLPAVHKLAMGGYDGKGVQVLNNDSDIEKGFDAPSVLEKKINIHQEIAIIIAVNETKQTAIYPPVEMVFNNILNLLDYQICPAAISEKVLWKSEAIALQVIKQLNSPGIFAVELFADKDENVFVNEIAPRVHNSGHHTIEGNYSSQFDMLWRVMLGYPLGNTDIILPSALVNIIGANNHTGEAMFEGLEEVLKMDNVFVHLYGKSQSKPGRKMGHVTILSNEKQELIHKANQIKHTLFVKSN